MTTTTAESIAAAIAEMHPAEELFASVLADEICAAAEVRKLALFIAMMYVTDRPTRQLSAPDFLRWCEKYKFISAAELKPQHEKEPSPREPTIPQWRPERLG